MKGIISRKGKQAVIYAHVDYLDDGRKQLSAYGCVSNILRTVWALKRSVGSLFKEGLFNALITYEKQEFIKFIIRVNRPQSGVTLMLMQGLLSLQ